MNPSNNFPNQHQQLNATDRFWRKQTPICPRCNSIDTNFSFYANRKHDQPRYFCKTCRRHWTFGGTLRDVPVGGRRRKNCRLNSQVSLVQPKSSLNSAAGEGAPGAWAAGEGAPGSWTVGEGAPGAWAAGEGAPGAWAAGEGAPGAWVAGEGAPDAWAAGEGAPGASASGVGAGAPGAWAAGAGEGDLEGFPGSFYPFEGSDDVAGRPGYGAGGANAVHGNDE